MSRRVDHSFENPAAVEMTVAYDPAPLLHFAVLAEEENVSLVGKICYVSWILGPGVKVYLRHGGHF